MKNKYSLFAIFLCFCLMAGATLIYYPKWNTHHPEKVISWDVAGYYQYLPAVIIYKDLKKVSYLEDVLEKYRFTPENQQTYSLPNGNRVMKYTMGQAIMFSPFFIVAHQIAKMGDYPADGFSVPYQLALEIEILFFAFLGLYFFRLILLHFFSDKIAALTIIGICLGSNYFEYASMTGAMTHNNLFALYCILIYLTIKFQKQPQYGKAITIGLVIGLMTLTRPTEAIAVLIPLFWGIGMPLKSSIRNRLNFIRQHLKAFILMVAAAAMIASLQLLYWKYVSGDWLVYSYGEEGFNWFKPQIKKCLVHMRSGWLVYSPLMIFSLIGFYYLYRSYKQLFPVIASTTLLAMYITFSWETWWYGGSLGQRALIQYYPLLAMPFAAGVEQLIKSKVPRVILIFSYVLFIYYNLWLSHQVHRGGLVKVDEMSRAYFWKVVGRYEKHAEDLKLLDTDEFFSGKPKNRQVLYFTDFEGEKIPHCHYPPIQGKSSFCMSSLNPESPEYSVSFERGRADWIRVSASFFCKYPVRSAASMGQLKVRFYQGDKELVKERMIRIHRLLPGDKIEQIHFDVRCPSEEFDQIGVQMNQGAKGNLLVFDEFSIEAFDQ